MENKYTMRLVQKARTIKMYFFLSLTFSLISFQLIATNGPAVCDITLQLNASYETCVGSCDGNVSVNADGGTGDYTYLWNTGDDFVVVYDACAGMYTVTVTDSDGCTAVDSIELELSPEGIWLMMSGTDVTCAGGSDGTAHVSVMTGEAPYQVEWSNGETGQDLFDIIDLTAGDYSVTVTDANGCSNADTITIDDGTGTLDLQLNASYETCVGSCDGNVSVNADGGSGDYSYLWNTGDDFVVVYDACAGIYTVTVTDNETGCIAVDSIELELSPEGIWLMMSGTDVTCAGGSDGTAHVSVMTGEAPYQVEWSNGETGQDLFDIIDLTAGDYSVTVTDANGCSNADTITIDDGTGSLDLQLNASYETCAGSCDGNVSVNADGGSGDYSYLWNTGDDFVVVDSACAGIYTVTVTDNVTGCIGIDSIELELSPEGIWLMMSGTDVTCNGGSDGTANVNVTTGTAPFQIEWSTGEMGENLYDIIDLTAGDYYVTVTDANGCSNSDTITIEEPPAISITIDEVGNASCNQNDGFINISVSGGTPGYTFEWSNGADTEDVDSLSAGTYSVTVTDDNGCTQVEGPIEVGEDSDLEVTLVSVTDADCAGNGGAIDISVSGGTQPYTYEWSSGDDTEDLSDKGPGDYSVTVTDAMGCTGTLGPITIGQMNSDIIIVLLTTTEADCAGNGGAIDISASGGTQPYTYEWSTGAMTQDLTDIGPGDYSVTVTDANDCTATLGPITIGQMMSDIVVSLVSATDSECNADNGSIDIDVTGGDGTYAFDWSNGAGTEDIDSLPPGTYSVTVTDGNGCTGTLGPIEIEEEDCCIEPVVASVVVIESPCGLNEGSATINMVGDNADFSFEWDPNIGTPNSTGNAQTGLPGGVYSVTITPLADPNCPGIVETFTIGTIGGPDDVTYTSTPATCNQSDGTATMSNPDYTYDWCNGDTGVMVINLPAGPCFVIITDPTTGCQDFITVIIDEENPLTAEATVNNYPDCGLANGSVTITADGGSGDYSYNWSNGNMTATDDDIASGSYCVTVTDNISGCEAVTCFVLVDGEVCATVVVSEPISTTCVGTDDATAVYDITYEPCFIFPETVEIVDLNGDSVTNGELAPGTYCIIVTDGNGCIAGSGCFDVVEPAQIDLDLAINNNCDPTPGIEIVSTSGGTPPYTYDWFDLPGTDNDEDRPDLETGSYDVTVTDANGCTAFANDLLVIDTCACPPMVISSVVIVETLCDAPTGQATVNISAPDSVELSYQWIPDVGIESNGGATHSALPTGTYQVIITNVNQPQCSLIEEFTVGSIDGPEADYISTPSLCGADDGTVTFDNPDLIYDWSDGGTGASRIDLPAGTYFVTISDPNGNPDCTDTKTVIVEETPSFSVSHQVNALPDCNEANGSVTIVPNPAGDYSYSWGNSDNLDNLPAGVYDVTVTDNLTGCTATTFFTLTENVPNAIVTVNADAFVSCPGSEDGLIDYSVNYGGGFAFPETITIVDLDGNEYDNGSIPSGEYCIIITDANGCVAGAECLVIRAPDQLDVDVAVNNQNCDENGQIELVEVIGGNGGYQYTWNPDVSTNTIASDLEPGEYSFTVTDELGCSVSETVYVEEDPNALSVLTSPDTTICGGSAVISVDAPTGNITWTNENDVIIAIDVTSIEVDTTGTYYVEVSNGNCVEMDSITVLNGEIDAQITTDTFACVGVPGQFITVDIDGIYSEIVWSPDSLIAGGQGSPTIEINAENGGVFEIFVEVNNAGTGCSDLASINVVAIDTSDSPEVFTELQCDGTTVEFTIAGGAPFYSWDFDNDGIIDTTGPETTVEFDYDTAGIYTPAVIIPALAECFENDTLTMEIEVIDPPLWDSNITYDMVECTDSAVIVVTDISTHAISAVNQWEWITNTSASSDSSSIIITVQNSQDVEIELIITTEAGCMDTISEIIPINLLEVDIPDMIACFNEIDTLNLGGNPDFSYEWSPSDVLSDPNAPSPIVDTNDPTMFIVTITDGQGLCSDIDTVFYDVIPEVIVDVAADGTILCDEGPITLTANSGANVDYTWYDQNGIEIGTGATLDNASPGGWSNDSTYYVVATTPEGCEAIDTVTIFNQGLFFEFDEDMNSCIGGTIQFNAIIPFEIDLTNAEFSWTGPTGNAEYNMQEVFIDSVSLADAGSYTLTLDNGNCDYTNTFNLGVSDFSDALATADPDTIFPDETSILDVTFNDGWDYHWMSDDGSFESDEISPEVAPEETTDYTVTITDDEGCVDVRTVTVTVVTICEEPYIFFPNAFSPNDDGANDVLYLRGQGVTDVYFAIYNRWGEKVYESFSQNDGWDGTHNGKVLSSDVYGFYLRVRCANNEEFYKQGNVTLFR